MDKSALVAELKGAFDHIDKEGTHVEGVWLIPAHTIFRNDAYVVVVATPDLAMVGTRTKIEAISQKLDHLLSGNAVRQVQQVWVFDDPEQARKRIESEDVAEFVIPIVEPAHA